MRDLRSTNGKCLDAPGPHSVVVSLDTEVVSQREGDWLTVI